MPNTKKPIDKEYLINSLKDFDEEILSKKYSNVSISAEAGNAISRKSDGLYVPPCNSVLEEETIIQQIIQKLTDDDLILPEDEIIKKIMDIIKTDPNLSASILGGQVEFINLISCNKDPIISGGLMNFSSFYKYAKGIELDENGYIKLHKGKTYYITFHSRCGDYNTTPNWFAHFFYDVTNNIQHSGVYDIQYSCSVKDIHSCNDHASFIYVPPTDVSVTLRTIDNPPPTANSTYQKRSLTIIEIAQPIVKNIDIVDFIHDAKEHPEDIPVGHIMAYMGNNCPAHYLKCDGSIYAITDYPHLSQHIEAEFGDVNYFGGDRAAGTFAVPDLRGEFLRGSGTATRNTGSGADVGVHQEPTAHQHIGKWYDEANNMNKLAIFSGLSHDDAWGLTPSLYYDAIDQTTPYCSTHDQHTGKVITDDEGVNKYTSRPTNTAVSYCIKCEHTYYVKIQEQTNISDEKFDKMKEDIRTELSEIIPEAEIAVSAQNGNQLEKKADGLFVPPCTVSGLTDTEKEELMTTLKQETIADVKKDDIFKSEVSAIASELAIDNCTDLIANGYQSVLNDKVIRGNLMIFPENMGNPVSVNKVFDHFQLADVGEDLYGLAVDADGYMIAPAGKLLAIYASFRLDNVTDETMCNLMLYNVDAQKQIGYSLQTVNNTKTTSDLCSNIQFFKFDVDTRISIKIMACSEPVTFSAVRLSVFEIAQPVINNVYMSDEQISALKDDIITRIMEQNLAVNQESITGQALAQIPEPIKPKYCLYTLSSPIEISGTAQQLLITKNRGEFIGNILTTTNGQIKLETGKTYRIETEIGLITPNGEEDTHNNIMIQLAMSNGDYYDMHQHKGKGLIYYNAESEQTASILLTFSSELDGHYLNYFRLEINEI